MNLATALWTGGGQGREVAGDRVALIVLRLGDDMPRHLDDLAHEVAARQLAVLHLRELELPLRRQLRREQLRNAEAMQQRHQRKCFRRRDQLLAFAMDVALLDQALDDLRARRRRAEPLLAHCLAQLLVLDQLPRTFHRRKKRRFGKARRRASGQRNDIDLFGRDLLIRLDGRERRLVALRFAAVHGEPSGTDQHLAFRFERLRFDTRDAGRQKIFRCRIEHGEKALDDKIVELRLDLA